MSDCKGGMKVGATEDGRQVWAHTGVSAGMVLCDSNRVFIAFLKKPKKAGQDVEVLTTLDDVAKWAAPIADCPDDVAKWAFIYDALVEELKSETVITLYAFLLFSQHSDQLLRVTDDDALADTNDEVKESFEDTMEDMPGLGRARRDRSPVWG
ncbi:hypothetical protein PTMSG1_10522 [Pyrenophora teres f. maculata]|nr:hypothetical protein PTMSG1_10522 [Pyrenophora teres f. maculata]